MQPELAPNIIHSDITMPHVHAKSPFLFPILFLLDHLIDSSGAYVHLFGIATCQRDDFSGRIDIIRTFIPICPLPRQHAVRGVPIIDDSLSFPTQWILGMSLALVSWVVRVGEWVEADTYCFNRVSARHYAVRGV